MAELIGFSWDAAASREAKVIIDFHHIIGMAAGLDPDLGKLQAPSDAHHLVEMDPPGSSR